MTKPPDAKRVKHTETSRTWDSTPFYPNDDSWLGDSPSGSRNVRDFFHSSTRVRLKPSTSLSGVFHKSLEQKTVNGVGADRSPSPTSVPGHDQNNEANGLLSGSSRESSGKSSGSHCSAAALIASVQGAAQKHSLLDSDSKAENVVDDDVMFEVPSTKPDASVLQLNFPLLQDSSDSNGPAAVVNFNPPDLASVQSPKVASDIRPVGLSFLARQQSWSLSSQPAENGIPSSAL